MDYSLFQVERIADELHENGVPIPRRTHPKPPTVDVPQKTEVTTSKSLRRSIYLPQWLNNHRFDPAAMVTFRSCQVIITEEHVQQGFMELLLDHLQERLFPNEDNTEEIFIEDDTLHEHPILNIKYTSYKVQQEKDIIHVGYD